MNYSLVDWTNGWFYSPGCLQTPKQDRLMCYIAAVLIIGDIVKGNHPSKYYQMNLHDYLTYLLLGWNPITSWPKHSEFDKPSDGGLKNIENVEPYLRELLDFTNIDNLSAKHAFVLNAFNIFKNSVSERLELYCGEQLTMLFLAHWLVDRKTHTPTDVICARACLDLYYTSCNSGYRETNNEYATSYLEPNYGVWFTKQMNRLILLDTDDEHLFRTIAYFGWFMSLIRVFRLSISVCRDSKWRIEITEQLSQEVEKLRDVLNNKPLKVISDTHRGFGATLFECFKGHVFKKKFH